MGRGEGGEKKTRRLRGHKNVDDFKTPVFGASGAGRKENVEVGAVVTEGQSIDARVNPPKKRSITINSPLIELKPECASRKAGKWGRRKSCQHKSS